jgi:hypothetical protein
VGIALAAAGIAAAAPVFAAPASSGYEEGLAAYQKNDYEKSLKVLRPLAEKGDVRAQYLVGRQYQFGQAVKANRSEAYYWYKRAEAKGHLEAKLFRLLLEKRWKISAADRSRAERKFAAENAPKPPPRVAQVESRPKRRPEKPAKAPAKPPEIAKAPATKRESEVARARPTPAKVELAKAKPEPAKAKAPENPAIVAARTAIPDETRSPPVQRNTTEIARATPRPPARTLDDDDDGPPPRRYEAPPPETRTTIAAVPNPPSDEHASDHSPYDDHSAPEYAPPPPTYAPPAPRYVPPVPYYSHGPAPYYAPAAPPSWRASVHFGPRPYYRQPWGYRPYAAYAHPGWRGPRGRW